MEGLAIASNSNVEHPTPSLEPLVNKTSVSSN